MLITATIKFNANQQQTTTNKQTNKQATPSEQFQDLSEKLQKTSKMEASKHIYTRPPTLLAWYRHLDYKYC
jgi:predicted RNA-binding protein with RPS1 domain